jgi:hypothetical protein
VSGLVMSLRSSAQHPGRVLAVWAFCVVTIVFWLGLLHYLTGLALGPTLLAIVTLALIAVPLAGRLSLIVWPPEEDGWSHNAE